MLPNRLKEQRERSRLNVTEVATLLGVSPSSVTKWENGDRSIPLAMVPELAKLFKVQTHELFNIDAIEAD